MCAMPASPRSPFLSFSERPSAPRARGPRSHPWRRASAPEVHAEVLERGVSVQVDENFESLPGNVTVPDGRTEQSGEDSLACARGTRRRARKGRKERIVRRIVLWARGHQDGAKRSSRGDEV